LVEADEFAQKNALVRFYFKINPNTLSDDEWAEAIEQIMWVLKFNGTIEAKK
jgi:hypothetical protein